MKTEIWKDIPGYEGIYQASNLGRIKSLSRTIKTKKNYEITKKEKILKQTTNYGYKQLTLCKDAEFKCKRVHRLVAESFIPNPDNLPCINHKNENRADNRVENLEWCDSKYNNNYGNRNKNLGIAKSKKVNQYDLDGNFIKTWDSITQVERELKIWNSNIVKVCKGSKNKAGGYIWRYEQNET